jgi:hypothetical protein
MYTAAAIEDAEVIDVDAEQSDFSPPAVAAVAAVATVPAATAVLPDADGTGTVRTVIHS